jgi:hypothetical protein
MSRPNLEPVNRQSCPCACQEGIFPKIKFHEGLFVGFRFVTSGKTDSIERYVESNNINFTFCSRKCVKNLNKPIIPNTHKNTHTYSTEK